MQHRLVKSQNGFVIESVLSCIKCNTTQSGVRTKVDLIEEITASFFSLEGKCKKSESRVQVQVSGRSITSSTCTCRSNKIIMMYSNDASLHYFIVTRSYFVKIFTLS